MIKTSTIIRHLFSTHLTLLALLLAAFALLAPERALAAGTWTPLAHLTPPGYGSGGIGYITAMQLLSDGTVICAGGSPNWYRLTPDTNGSYVNGTWSTITPANKTHIYASAQLLRDGRFYVGGAEYGDGGSFAEIYQPTNDTWLLMNPADTAFPGIEINLYGAANTLPNGNVIATSVNNGGSTFILDIVSNTWSVGPAPLRDQDEGTWLKLPDDSLLTIDIGTQASERYIPSLNQWVEDGAVPVVIYDDNGEMGGGHLLPNGKAIFIGGFGHTAIYTPSGTTNAGTWVAGPDLPNGRGQSDAPAAMMVNGKILLACGPANGLAVGDTQFYEYNYVSNTFAIVNAFNGRTNYGSSTFGENMLCLPDGSVLWTPPSAQLFIYTPDGTPLAAGRPTILGATTNLDGSFHVTGTLFNGISEGACYGDDNQNRSAYPIARLTNSLGHVQYARTYNWSSQSVMTGTNILSTEMRLPGGLLPGTYPLVISANGNPSVPYSLTITGTPLPPVTGLAFTSIASNQMAVSWSALGSTEAGYVVQRSTDGASFSTIGSVASNVTAYADNTVTPLGTYYYRVLGTNVVGLGSVGQTIFAASPPVVALPSPWSAQDIGAVSGSGASGQTAGTYTVIGSGSGIGGGSDQFQFASQLMAGDCTITARVTAESAAGSNALAGVMIRSGLGSGAANVFMAFGAGSTNFVFQSRSNGGGATTTVAGSGSTPLWVRLVRSGNAITGYTSPDGSAWTQRGSVLVIMPPAAYAGFAVSSGDNTRLNTATLDNVTVSGTPPLIAPPLAYWKLDETSGTTAVDSVGGYNGTYNNCVLGQPGATAGTGTSVGFNGTNASIPVPALNLNNNVVTITAWVNPNGYQNSGPGILYSRANSTVSGFAFGGANELAYTWNADPATYTYSSGLLVPTNQWTYVALVVEPTRARLYMITNGVLSGATNSTAHAVQGFDGPSYIGQDPIGGRNFNGKLDEVSFYANQALSPAQLTALASPPAIAISNPLAGYYLPPATINLAAAVSQTSGHTINLVQLFNNGALVGQSATPPYTNTLTGLAAGSYALSARLFYDSGLALESSPVNIVVGVNPAPTNIVASVAGTTLTLSWPADHTGWRLLTQTNNLANGLSSNTNDWATVSGSASTNLVSLPIIRTNKAGFFRLIYP